MISPGEEPPGEAARSSLRAGQAPGAALEPGREEAGAWPGVIPVAQWFLRAPAGPPAGSGDAGPPGAAGAVLPGGEVQDGELPGPGGSGLPEGPAGLRSGAGVPRAGGAVVLRASRAGPGRRLVAAAGPSAVVAVVAVVALALLTGHGPDFGRASAAADAAAPRGPSAAVTLPVYPGQQQRGVFRTVSRIVASGRTIVAIGSQAGDGVVRQQFFTSADGGQTWHLAPLRTPDGGQAPLGYAAALLAGGPDGWMAEGPQAIWTSRDGLTWTLAATHGITPRQPGDSVWVVTRTARGFLAAGSGKTAQGGPQAVIWTSGDGLTWQRMTAAQLGLAGPGETVPDISYATWRGNATVISGQVTSDGASYSAAWRSTDGGRAWTRVTVPADHGAGSQISGLGADAAGIIAVRAGRSAGGAADGVAYFSPDGRTWRYAATVGAGQGWAPGVVKGSDAGLVVTGSAASGRIVAYTSTGAGTAWQPTAALGSAAAESVVSATVAADGTAIAVGSTAPGKAGQEPVFLEADSAGAVRPVPVAAIPGGDVPEAAVNSLAVAGGEQVAVGSADGYPAVWRQQAGGPWELVSSLGLVSGFSPVLRSLTSVTHGPAGWLAVGVPGPVALTSADGTTWRAAGGGIAEDLAGVASVTTAAGPAGYVIAGTLAGPGGTGVADIWWSPDLIWWARAHDVNLAAGSSQVLTVAATARGFVSAGSHDGSPAVWTTVDGVSWTTILLPVPGGASAAVLQQIAVKGNRVAALGLASTAAGTVPVAELSADGGATWRQVPFSAPGPDAAFTAVAATPDRFAAAGLFGGPGRQDIAEWASATGAAWMPSRPAGRDAAGTRENIVLAPAGAAAAVIASIATQQEQQFVSGRLG